MPKDELVYFEKWTNVHFDFGPIEHFETKFLCILRLSLYHLEVLFQFLYELL